MRLNIRFCISIFASLIFHFGLLFGPDNVFIEQGTYAIADEVMVVSMELIPEAPVAVAMLVAPVEEIKKETLIKPIKKQVAEVKKTTVVKQEPKIARESRARMADSSTVKYDLKARPDYLKNPPPVYPWDSKRNREQGVVLLTVDIDSKGNVLKVKMRKSSGYSRLDSSALKSVSTWSFKPARLAGIAVESTAIVPVRFVLR